MAIYNRRRQAPSEEFHNAGNNRMIPRWTRPPERNTQDWMKMYAKNPRLAVVTRIASDLSFASGKLLTIDSNGNEREVTGTRFLSSGRTRTLCTNLPAQAFGSLRRPTSF